MPLWCLFCFFILHLIVLWKHRLGFLFSQVILQEKSQPQAKLFVRRELPSLLTDWAHLFDQLPEGCFKTKGVICWQRSLKKQVFFFTRFCLKAPPSFQVCSAKESGFICVKIRLLQFLYPFKADDACISVDVLADSPGTATIALWQISMSHCHLISLWTHNRKWKIRTQR